jgi:hypothetical protein
VAEQSGANQRKRDLLLGSVAKPDPKIVGNLTEEQLQSGLRGGARAQKSEKDKELERQTNLLKSIEKELKGT